MFYFFKITGIMINPISLASNRNIDLTSDAREILNLILMTREEMGIQKEFVFTERDGKRLHCLGKSIGILNARIELPNKRSIHDIRCTYASI